MAPGPDRWATVERLYHEALTRPVGGRSAFLAEACAAHDKKPCGITPEAVRKLSSYNWPGNIRQLRSVIEQMVVLADGRSVWQASRPLP